MCVESEIVIDPIIRRFGIVLSAILLYIEYFIVRFYDFSKENGCYILLVPLCFFIFMELLAADNLKIKNSVTLRKMSTIIYCSHISVQRICSGGIKIHCSL